MTKDRAVELLRGMQRSLLTNNGRLRSMSHVLDESRVTAMDLAIEALRAQIETEQKASLEPASSFRSKAK
jgi:hypothetical protein